MPSDKADEARKKAMEVMSALDSGKPGAADRVMGDRDQTGTQGIIPLGWLKSKFSKKDKKKTDDVIR